MLKFVAIEQAEKLGANFLAISQRCQFGGVARWREGASNLLQQHRDEKSNRTYQKRWNVGGSLGFFKKRLPEVVSSLDNALRGASTSLQVPEL